MNDYITVVSGLPRSGTSMMMKMLEASGMEVVTDHVRKADQDNPKGYYEFEKVKDLKKDAGWMTNLNGKVIKIISMLLYYLPLDQRYKIIFVRRNLREILASQKKMLERRGQPLDDVPDSSMARKFEDHLGKISDWLKDKKNIECLYINYSEVIKDPVTSAGKVRGFLQMPLDVEAMAVAVDPNLYRNRS
ncbi:MAG: sulfotransferase family protein [Desulfobacterales bacterium]|nr:sulfotransferase family protein [Desulfobacterales bacterium]